MSKAARDTCDTHVAAVLGRLRPRGVTPAAASEHARAAAATGRAHTIAVRTDVTYGLRFVLDLPLPQQLDCRPWSCHTCNACFTPTVLDMKDTCPELLQCTTERSGEVLLTRQYLLHVVGNFYETLNARSVRRSMVEYYTADSLALTGGARGLWLAAAVPRPNLLRRLICTALERYLPPIVKHMEQHVQVYSGSAVKGDGHQGIAARIVQVERDPETGRPSVRRPCTVLLAWTGVDGAVLKPPCRKGEGGLIGLPSEQIWRCSTKT